MKLEDYKDVVFNNLSYEEKVKFLNWYSNTYTKGGTIKLSKEERSKINKRSNYIRMSRMSKEEIYNMGKRMSNTNIGKKQSQETIAKRSAKLKGRVFNEEWKKKISINKKEYWNNLSKEEKLKIRKKQQAGRDSRTEEQKEQSKQKYRDTVSNWSEERKKYIKDKKSKSCKNTWSNKSNEEMDLFRQIHSDYKKDYWKNITKEQYDKFCKNISIRQKEKWKNMSEQDRNDILKVLRENGINNYITEESKKRIVNKMRQTKYKNGTLHKNTFENKTNEEMNIIKNKIGSKNKLNWNNKTIQEQNIIRNKISNGVNKFYDNISNEDRNKMFLLSAKKSADTRNKCIALDGAKLDSNWELIIWNYCINNDIDKERNIPISFIYDNIKHTTLIDFKLNNKLYECKGAHLLQGIFDYAQKVPIKEKLKIYKENDVTIITNDEGIKYLKDNNIDINYKNIKEFKNEI